MQYNTERVHLKLREYGRNVQQMTDHLLTIEDRETRNNMAHSLVELMKSINPNINNAAEYDQKVWDDLVIISDFKLDADGPYPKPDSSVLEKKPQRVLYQSNNIRYRHFGKSLEKLIDKAIALTDEQEKKGAVILVGKLMKSFYQAWNKETISDEQIVKLIRQMSGNELDISLEEATEFALFDSSVKEMRREGNDNRPHRSNQGGGGRFHNNKGGKKNNSNSNTNNNTNNRRRR